MANRLKIHGKRQIQDASISIDRLETDFLKGANWDINSGNVVDPATITGIPDPTNDTDVVNKRFLAQFVAEASGTIGEAEDGSYTDGLFTDFVPSTNVGVATDRFNEVLKSLCPQPSPFLSAISSATNGVAGKLSFGPSNAIAGYTNHPSLDVGGVITVSGAMRGIINTSTNINGTLASNVTPNFTNSRPYPNLSFGSADQGTLKLVLNDVVIHTVDLSTFGSGNTLTSNSGFNLSAATSVAFDNGNLLELFKYRTGTLVVHSSAMRNGYNVVKVEHTIAGTTYTTTVIEWIVDAETAATTVTEDTLASLNMTGSKYISGVNYYTAGTAVFNATVNNAYRNTFSSSATAISFTGTNCTATSNALSTPTTNLDTYSINSKSVTISSVRLLNAAISLSTSVLRTLQGTVTSTVRSISNILMDPIAEAATNTFDSFNGESYRLHSGLVLSNTSYGTGGPAASGYTWDSTQNLLSGSATHNTGLLISNGSLTYPKVTSHITGITNGNFSGLANGPTNPDYSGATGTRTYYRYFYDAAARSNFKLAITSTSTSFVPVATGASANNLTLEVLAPDTTSNGTTLEFKDAMVAYSNVDSIGCGASTYGSSIATGWGMTLGTKNTSTSGKVIVVKITASANWTGRIDDLTLTWL